MAINFVERSRYIVTAEYNKVTLGKIFSGFNKYGSVDLTPDEAEELASHLSDMAQTARGEK